METCNIYSILEESAKRWGTKPAIYDDQGLLPFQELYEQVEKVKERLIDQGIAPGMGLGVMGRNSREFVIAVFAGLACGVTILPISHQIRAAELAAIIHETSLHAIVDDRNGVSPTLSDLGEIPIAGSNWRLSKTNFVSQIAPHVANPAFIRFTSGTTGKSKGVIISHQSILERIEAANKGLKLDDSDTVLWVLPMAYHFIVSIVLYLKYGVSIAIAEDFLAKSILEKGNRYEATMLYASPMHIRLLASDRSQEKFSTLKKVISTSTAISSEMCEAFRKRFQIEVSQAYGIIEIGLPILNDEKSKEYPDAVGFTLPDYQVEILNEELQVLPFGEAGHLAIKGPGMFDGYLNPPAVKEEILRDGWFLTGDLATKSEDGLIEVVGRRKSMINVSGNKVFPEEVEAVIEQHPFVEACKVLGENHILMGEIVKAEILLKEGKTIEAEAIISYCRDRLSTYKIPQRVQFVKSIEKTGSGKILRN